MAEACASAVAVAESVTAASDSATGWSDDAADAAGAFVGFTGADADDASVGASVVDSATAGAASDVATAAFCSRGAVSAAWVGGALVATCAEPVAVVVAVCDTCRESRTHTRVRARRRTPYARSF